MKALIASPFEGDRNLVAMVRQIKDRAVNRSVKMSSEIKQSSEWTMGKVVEKVIEQKRIKAIKYQI